jgi:hypothetical protein
MTVAAKETDRDNATPNAPAKIEIRGGSAVMARISHRIGLNGNPALNRESKPLNGVGTRSGIITESGSGIRK